MKNTDRAEQSIPWKGEAEDIPFVNADSENRTASDNSEKMSQQDMNRYERMANVSATMNQIRMKNRAFTLVVIALSSLGVLYFVDLILLNFNLVNSSMTNGLTELLKCTVSSAVGYAFAENTKHSSGQ